ncbi:MAG: hypothetical protein DDT32_02124 [Syntrophomonadaceae bacterium]|nr:hypothetical protein [Bacillota bacterium]MBT9148352.1 hypothetical protein [Bacillota bacterium]
MNDYEQFSKNRERVVSYYQDFHKIFQLQLRDYLNIVIEFDVLKFDQHLNVPEGFSIREWVRQEYGEEAVILVETLKFLDKEDEIHYLRQNRFG